MSLSLGSKSSGQTWWHLPLSRYRPWRHRVHVSLFTQDSQSAGHSAKTTAVRCICLYLGCPNPLFKDLVGFSVQPGRKRFLWGKSPGEIIVYLIGQENPDKPWPLWTAFEDPCKIQPKNHALGFLKLTGSTFPLCFVADEPLGAGLLAFAQVKVESCSTPRAEVLGEAGVTLWPALLTKKNRPTASVYLNHKLSSASRMLNIHRVTVLHVSLGIQLRVQIDVLYTDALDLI